MSNIVMFIIIDAVLILGTMAWLFLMVRSRRTQRDFHIKLITILTSTVAIRDLLERVAMEIQQVTSAKHASFFVYKADNHFVSSGTNGYLRLTRSDGHMLEAYFVRTKKTSIRTSNLDNESETRRLLNSYRIEFTLPLIRAGEIIGFLFLGPKESGKHRTRDIGLVGNIKDEIAIAIQNAVSLEAVRELNANLQQRVDAATDELRLSNEKLRGLDVAKDEFLSMASHQLRTPLTSVKGYISMVLEGDGGKITKVQKQLLSEAFTSSERMVHLINDFLNVSRVQTGKFMIDRHDVDLARVVKQEVKALITTAESRDLTLRVEVPEQPVNLSLDEGKIRQVIMNFIDNALFYSRPGTEIVISLVAGASAVELKVRDRGIGVPARQQAKLFTKFFRADNARLQRPDGTGVGLYLAKKVIDGHGGKLIFSSREGQGSTFGFRLPLKSLAPNQSDDSNHAK